MWLLHHKIDYKNHNFPNILSNTKIKICKGKRRMKFIFSGNNEIYVDRERLPSTFKHSSMISKSND